MRKILASLLAAAFLAGCGAPVSPTATAARGAIKAMGAVKYTGAGIFKRLDLDADGKLTLPEFRQLGIFGVNGRIWEPAPLPPLPEAQAATFKSFDKDRDGLVSGDEFENFGVALQYALEFDSMSQFYTELFPTLDVDADGRLTPAEWSGLGFFGVYPVDGAAGAPADLGKLLAASFKGLDGNRDGFLTPAELTFR